MWIQLDSNVRKKMAASLPGDFPSVGKLSPYFALHATINWQRFAIHGTPARSSECEHWVKPSPPVTPQAVARQPNRTCGIPIGKRRGGGGSNGLNLRTKRQLKISFWQLMWLETTINYDYV
jgi:hypothetical protein